MKLILASSGFTSPEAVEKCAEFVGKPKNEISFGVINEAYVPYHFAHDWVINDLVKIRDNFSNDIELIPLSLETNEIKRRVFDKDVIFVIGGSTSYLKTVFDKSGFSELLPELLKTKVYVGSSAGSMILGHCPSMEILQKRDVKDEDDFSKTGYLDLLDLEIIPHIDDSFTLPDTEKQPYPIYGLSDHAALIVEDEKTYLVGNGYKVFGDGKIIQKSTLN